MRLPSRICAVLAFGFGLLLLPDARAATDPDWTTPLAPFRIADNLYYVGSRDLAAYLVTTPAGNVLINANLPSSPPQIRQSVEQLGFRWSDLKILLISHAHVDHAGGSAAITRQTGAQLDVMEGDAAVMESGGKTDFAFGHAGKGMQYPPAHVNRVLHDGDAVTLGGTTLIAHRTAGHTEGCTTWTMKVHLPGEPAGRLRDVVIGGSWTVLSSYRLVDNRNRAPSYPSIARDYNRTFALLHTLPCDIFLASHGQTFDLLGKRKRMSIEGDAVWIDPAGYRRAVDAAQKAFETALQRQSSAGVRTSASAVGVEAPRRGWPSR